MPRERTLTARNDGGMRTILRAGSGLTVIADEPAARGGIGTAPPPEAVIAPR